MQFSTSHAVWGPGNDIALQHSWHTCTSTTHGNVRGVKTARFLRFWMRFNALKGVLINVTKRVATRQFFTR